MKRFGIAKRPTATTRRVLELRVDNAAQDIGRNSGSLRHAAILGERAGMSWRAVA